ncbi:MAG TPA: SRPBCC domain-containing protein, partial [Puia sp.]|nr:SRPBCC domain-containing protein [Puia sp.]
MDTKPYVLERTFDASVSNVWKALTQKELMKKWYFDLAEFKAEVGFEFTFKGGALPTVYTHFCKVIEVIFEKKLSYTWRYDGFTGNSIVTFELFPEGKKTKLRLTHAGLETFPYDHPGFFARENFA